MRPRRRRRTAAAFAGVAGAALAAVTACTVFDDRRLPSTGADGGAVSCDAGQTAADPHNCGTCGHDCLGGSCSAASCQPWLLVPASDAGAPVDIAVDATSVFWTTDDGSIHRVGKDGSSPTLLRTAAGGGGSGRIAVDDAALYYSNESLRTVLQLSKDGAVQATFLESGDLAPGSLAATGAALFWTHVSGSNLGGIMRASLPMDGGAREIWAGRQYPGELAADDHAVYWGENYQNLEQAAGDGTGPVLELASCSFFRAVAASDASVFFTSDAGVTAVPKDQSDQGNCASPGAQVVAPDPSGASGLALAGPGVVVFSDPAAGQVRSVRLGGACSGPCVKTLARGQPAPGRVAADAQAAYWVNRDGSVGKVAF